MSITSYQVEHKRININFRSNKLSMEEVEENNV